MLFCFSWHKDSKKNNSAVINAPVLSKILFISNNLLYQGKGNLIAEILIPPLLKSMKYCSHSGRLKVKSAHFNIVAVTPIQCQHDSVWVVWNSRYLHYLTPIWIGSYCNNWNGHFPPSISHCENNTWSILTNEVSKSPQLNSPSPV